MRRELVTIVDALLASSALSREVTLDAVGDAIGARAITPREVDAILSALEAAGRTVVSPEGGAGEAHLAKVLAAARALGPELGRKPTIAEIAARCGLSESDVRHAFELAKIMQR